MAQLGEEMSDQDYGLTLNLIHLEANITLLLRKQNVEEVLIVIDRFLNIIIIRCYRFIQKKLNILPPQCLKMKRKRVAW